jgi:D-amino-acid dehydrogenase
MHVVIMGAGIVGACTALEALSRGFQVTIVEPGDPGGEQAASFGNGCWLSPASVIPPAVPGLWKRLPRFLLDPLGPLSIRWTALPRLAPWLLRYLLAGWTEARVARTARALRALLADAPARHKALAKRAGVGPLIEQRGLAYVYETRAQFAAEAMAWRIRAAVGVTWRELDSHDLRQREPQLDRRYGFGVLVEDGGHCRDPGRYVAALVGQAVAEGARLRRARATGFRTEAGRLAAVRLEDGAEILCDRAIIAAGIHSRSLAAAAGTPVPLESERGYHAMIEAPPVGPRTPLMPVDGKMSVTLTDGGLRCSGQVEMAGVAAAPDWRRAAILRDHLLRSFPGLPRDLPAERVRFWMGHRPSMPDGLPCIGWSPGLPQVMLAFGHGHVGLAAAPATAHLVGALLAGEPPGIDAAPYRPSRF